MKKVANLSRTKVIKALRDCIDPELGIDIVSLGLIYGVSIKLRSVTVTMTLTTPGCPLWTYFHQRVTELIKNYNSPGMIVRINLTFDPAWEPNMIDPRSRSMMR